MRGIKIKTKAGRASGSEMLPVVTLLLLLAGVFGLLLLFRSPEGITFSLWVVVPLTAGFNWALWYSFLRNRRLFYALILGTLVLGGLSAWYLREDLVEQILHIVRSFQGTTQQMSVTFATLLAAALLSLLLFALECCAKCHAPAYLLTTALLLASPFLGIEADLGTLFLLLLFQFAFWVIRVASRRGKKGSLIASKSLLAGKSAVAFALIFAVVFLAVLPVAISFSDTFYGSVYMAEEYVRGNLRHLTGKESKPITGGKISAGNNYRFGTEHLYLTTNAMPTETLYLRGFSGGEYLGGDWAETEDADLFMNVHAAVSHVTTSDEIADDAFMDAFDDFEITSHSSGENLYTTAELMQLLGMYYDLNRIQNAGNVITLTVQHCNNTYETAYEPYYDMHKAGWSEFAFDASLAEKDQGYTVSYYEQKDMQIDWERVALMAGTSYSTSGYLTMRDAFAERVQQLYTQVPTELVPRLAALVKETPLTDLDEITAFILYTLHSNTSYTLSPGWSSFNQDITECFLFERGKGFCEHYAATATLLYRLYGIPARYAAGYVVSPASFEQHGKESYSAVITDESAHAWVEIFLKDYGWTPVEVTPSADGYTVVSYPGFDTLRLHQIWQEHGWDISVPSFSVRNERDPSLDGQTTERLPTNTIEPRDLLLIPLMGICYAVLLLPLYFVKRRTRLLQKIERWDCRRVFYQLLETLRFGELLPEYGGSEPDFATRLSECVPTVSQKEAETLVEMLNEAAFGPLMPGDEKDAFVRSVYHRVTNEVYGRLSGRKKLVFKWIRVFG